MKIISSSKLPKRDYCRAAECRFDFDQIAEKLWTIPIQGNFHDGLPIPNQYTGICIELSSGRFASLMQTSMRESVIEIGLEIFDDEFFYEEDLLEIIAELQIEEVYVKRIQGDFTWIPRA